MRNNEIAAKFSNWKQKISENADVIFCTTILIIYIAFLCYSEISYMNQIRIVENPTFTGEVVGKETGYFPPWSGAAMYYVRQLHVIHPG